MRGLHKGVKQDHKLRHQGRQQYWLYLKGAGLSMEDSIRFFQAEFTKVMTGEQFQKEHMYNIRHAYGTCGPRLRHGRVTFTPRSRQRSQMWSCARDLRHRINHRRPSSERHSTPFNPIHSTLFTAIHRYSRNANHSILFTRRLAGKEGKRTSYSPYSCMKIIMGPAPGQGEHHGCPYRHQSEQSISALFGSMNINGADREKIMVHVKKQAFQVRDAT